MQSGRCYCGASTVTCVGPADIVTYCHCADCKRWTGAPAPAFAAFANKTTQLSDTCVERELTAGVIRWNCGECGSPMAASFDYFPDQIYVPLGILDRAPALQPSLHCHAEQRLGWLANDALPTAQGSGRDTLRRAE